MQGIAAELQVAVVEIGGLPVRLFTDNASFLEMARERYGSFLRPGNQAGIDLTIDLAPPGILSAQEDVCVTRQSTRWRAERGDFHLDWDSESGQGVLRQSCNPYSLDTALRILHTLVLAKQGGFLLHAASAVRNGRAFLFFGASGAGKTTITRAAPADAVVLTDEISYVRRFGEGYAAYGTPFTGELAKLGENVSAPIAGLYHLVQAPHNRISPLGPGDAARALLESILFFAEDAELVKCVFQSACDIVSRVPVYRLDFMPDQRVWDLIV